MLKHLNMNCISFKSNLRFVVVAAVYIMHSVHKFVPCTSYVAFQKYLKTLSNWKCSFSMRFYFGLEVHPLQIIFFIKCHVVCVTWWQSRCNVNPNVIGMIFYYNNILEHWIYSCMLLWMMPMECIQHKFVIATLYKPCKQL